jgi:hypothetical protein
MKNLHIGILSQPIQNKDFFIKKIPRNIVNN